MSPSASPSPTPCLTTLSIDLFSITYHKSYTLSLDKVEVLFLIDYESSYINVNNNYSAAYSNRYNCYYSKYAKQNTSYSRKYVPKNAPNHE